MKIEFTDSADKKPAPKILVYGAAGAGKTRLCATAPRPIILSAEAGLLSLRDQHVATITIKNVTDLEKAFNYLKNDSTYYTICLDSISEIAEICLADAQKNTKDGRMAYGVLNEKMIGIIKLFRDLEGKAVVMTAQTEYAKDDVTGVMRWQPSAPGKQLTKKLPYLFDEVFALVRESKVDASSHNYLRTRGNLQYDAKDRSGKLDEIEQSGSEVNLTDIFKKILA